MRIDIVTLFPAMFEGFVNSSIIKRAIENNYVEVNIVDLREYTTNKQKKGDDTPYGGGAGMVLTCQPVFDCVKALRKEDTKVLMMTPQGKTYKQQTAYEFAKMTHIIILCGHYEGFDERIRTLVDYEVSLGDYVLTGGETASMVIADSIIRLIDGVIEKESHENDSFSNGLLEYPQYTKPRVYEVLEVPEVLCNGNHKEIAIWKHKESLRKTYFKRPDLLENYSLSEQEAKWIEEFKNKE